MTREQLKDYGIKVTQANGTELVKLTLELAAEYVGEAEKSVDDRDLFTARINKARAYGSRQTWWFWMEQFLYGCSF